MAINTTYAQTGVSLREDVLDTMFQITPEDTPWYNMIGDSTAMAPQHQWPIRSLTTRQGNAQQQGASLTSGHGSLILPTRETNLTQILRKLIRVPRTHQSSVTIGVNDLLADQIAENAVEWKTDAEHALLRESLTSATSADADAQRMQGLFNAITLNGFNYGSTGTFDETMLNDLAEHIWNDGGKAQDGLVGAKLKRRISQFTDSATKFFASDDRRVINTISVYESDFHTTQFHLSRDVRSATGQYDIALVDRSFFSKAWLDTPIIERLPKTADALDAVIIGELTLEFGNEQAAGIYYSLQQNGL